MICSHYCRCCVNIRYQRQIIVAIIVDEYDIIILLTSKCFSEVWGIPVPKEILCVLKLVYLSVTTYLSSKSCTIKIISAIRYGLTVKRFGMIRRILTPSFNKSTFISFK